jgi:hypothetical protein
LSRDWRIHLSDMIDRCDRVLAYTRDLPREQFDQRSLAYDATLRNIELLGRRPAISPRKYVKRHRVLTGAAGSGCHLIESSPRESPELHPAPGSPATACRA